MITANDLFILKEALWPHVTFWSRQVEIIESVVRDACTVVPSCHEAGKDFVSGFIVPACFTLCAALDIQCKIVTSSATAEHLGNLWGEIDFFMRTSKLPLTRDRGGKQYLKRPLVYLPLGQQLGRYGESEQSGTMEHESNSYVVSRVITNNHKGEGLTGHHATWTLWVADECSGMATLAFEKAETWADHCLLIGNPYPSADGDHFFKKLVEQGDVLAGV